MIDATARIQRMKHIRQLTQIESLHCWMAGYRGGGAKPMTIQILHCEVDLPRGIDAIIATSDLQSRETASGGALAGEILPLLLAVEILPTFFELEMTNVVVLLCGDFYADERLEERGIAGDASTTWLEFRDLFGCVAGVAGNHDSFPTQSDQFLHETGIYLLDGDIVSVKGMQIGGLGGIVSSKRLPHRRTEEAYVKMLAKLLDFEPDLLLMHDGPMCGQNVGNLRVAELIRKKPPTLIIRGHAHWHPRLVNIGKTQILNVHEAVVVMTPRTKVTEAGLKKLQQALPNCEIGH